MICTIDNQGIQKHGPKNNRLVKSGVFIEPDGILNQARIEGQDQVNSSMPTGFHPNTGAIPLLSRLKAAGLVLIVTTNQPGLSRGYQSRRELDQRHELLRTTFPVDDILVCPHDEMDDCPCRKPKPGLFVEAVHKWHLDLSRCFAVSDKWQDAEAARRAGCQSVLLQSPWLGREHYDLVLPDLAAIVDNILRSAGCAPVNRQRRPAVLASAPKRRLKIKAA
jgi:D-glycero-D-manno-heptose 1,7-bisphosphate phosphatase